MSEKQNEPSTLTDKLRYIQQRLNAPKDLRNDFGKYNYRSCESILQAVKPLLEETKTALLLNDAVEVIGNRFYLKAKATLCDGFQSISTTAYAREDEAKKGMDGAQLTGATSSYARKYALNALFCIDDNKDADGTNKHKTDRDSIVNAALEEIACATSTESVRAIYRKYLSMDAALCSKTGRIYKAVIARGEQLKVVETPQA